MERKMTKKKSPLKANTWKCGDCACHNDERYSRCGNCGLHRRSDNPLHQLRYFLGKLTVGKARVKFRPMGQVEFAELVGVSQGTVSKIESETLQPCPEVLHQIQQKVPGGFFWAQMLLEYYSQKRLRAAGGKNASKGTGKDSSSRNACSAG